MRIASGKTSKATWTLFYLISWRVSSVTIWHPNFQKTLHRKQSRILVRVLENSWRCMKLFWHQNFFAYGVQHFRLPEFVQRFLISNIYFHCQCCHLVSFSLSDKMLMSAQGMCCECLGEMEDEDEVWLTGVENMTRIWSRGNVGVGGSEYKIWSKCLARCLWQGRWTWLSWVWGESWLTVEELSVVKASNMWKPSKHRKQKGLTCVRAEHSTYFTAFSSRASFSPIS